MKFTIAAVNCMIQEGTENIIVDPDTTQLQVFKEIFVYFKGKMEIFNELSIYFRKLEQNLHLHLIAWKKMLYVVILLVALRRQNFWKQWKNVNMLVNIYLISIEIL